MAAEKYLPVFALALPALSVPAVNVDDLLYCRNRIAQTGAVALGIAWKRRSEGLLLPEGKIAAQDGVAVSTKSFGERY
jgi:hypothetical protein